MSDTSFSMMDLFREEVRRTRPALAMLCCAWSRNPRIRGIWNC